MGHDVKIIAGSCSCSYSCQERIHIFSVFNQFAWNWSDLPVALTQSAYITLETDLLETDQLPYQELDKWKCLTNSCSRNFPLPTSRYKVTYWVYRRKIEIQGLACFLNFLKHGPLPECICRKWPMLHMRIVTPCSGAVPWPSLPSTCA